MEVMQPRTRKGPSWANGMNPADPSPAGRPKRDQQPAENVQASSDDLVPEVALSDQEWMKRRMSKNVDVVEKVFEQSDDEEDVPAELVRRFVFGLYFNVDGYL